MRPPVTDTVHRTADTDSETKTEKSVNNLDLFGKLSQASGHGHGQASDHTFPHLRSFIHLHLLLEQGSL